MPVPRNPADLPFGNDPGRSMRSPAPPPPNDPKKPGGPPAGKPAAKPAGPPAPPPAQPAGMHKSPPAAPPPPPAPGRTMGAAAPAHPPAPPSPAPVSHSMSRPITPPAAPGRQASNLSALRPPAAPPARPAAPPPSKPMGGPARPVVAAPAPQVNRSGGNRAGLQAVNLPGINAAFPPEVASEISSLQSSISTLQSKASLTEVQADVSQLDQNLSRLSHTLEAVRKQGYVYSGDIDSKLNNFAGQWQQVKPKVDDAIYQQGSSLVQNVNNLRGPLTQLQSNPANARALLPQVTSSVNSALSSARQVESNIQAMYSSIESGVSEIDTRLSLIEQVLKWFGDVKFKLAQAETPVGAVPAEMGTDKDSPNGYLFLTDKRLLFEQKEEIVKKKVLFIATEKEMVHQLLLETPLTNVGSVTASKKGLLGHEDHLDVAYSGKNAHFHINGQDSKVWQALIEKAKAGGLENERATAAAGISIADMTGPITQADIVALQGQVNDLQGRAMLTFAKDALEDMGGKVAALPGQLGNVRAKGYAFEKALEAQVGSLGEQWAKIKQSVDNDIRQQGDSLGKTMQTLNQQMAQVMAGAANPNGVRATFLQVKSMAASAEAQASAAEQAIYKQYDTFQASVETLSVHLDWVNWLLEALATASFRLLATEGGVAATQVNYLRPNDGPQGGILFVTDQRLIFEEREGEFSVPLESPLAQLQTVDALTGQGAGKDEEHLKLAFASGGPVSTALFQLVGPAAADWKTTVSRAMKGDYTNDRAVAVDQAAVDKVKNAPTQCSNCGAAFTKPVLRGQTEITCEFCGAVTRL